MTARKVIGHLGKGTAAFVFGILLGFFLTFGVPVKAGDGMVTFSSGTKLPAASINLIVTAFRNGKFYDSGGAGSNYLGVSHNGTDGVIATNTGKVRISPPTGSTIDLEVNGTDVLVVAGSNITASQPLWATSAVYAQAALNVSGNAVLTTFNSSGAGVVNGSLTGTSGFSLTGGNAAITNNVGVTGSLEVDANFKADSIATIGGATSIGSTLGVTGVTTLTGALTASSTTASALNYGVQLSTSASNNSALDAYYKTTWTPSVSGTSSAGAGTYSTQVGTYTRVGNLVHFTYNITITAHTGTGNIVISLPGIANTVTGVRQTCPAPEFQNFTLPANQVMGSMLIDPTFNNVAQLRTCPNTGGGSCAALAIDTAMTIQGSCTLTTQ